MRVAMQRRRDTNESRSMATQRDQNAPTHKHTNATNARPIEIQLTRRTKRPEGATRDNAPSGAALHNTASEGDVGTAHTKLRASNGRRTRINVHEQTPNDSRVIHPHLTALPRHHPLHPSPTYQSTHSSVHYGCTHHGTDLSAYKVKRKSNRGPSVPPLVL